MVPLQLHRHASTPAHHRHRPAPISIACADDAQQCPNPNEERCELGVVVYILPNPKDNMDEGGEHLLGRIVGGGVRGVK